MAPSLSFSPPPRRPLIAVASMYRPKWSGDKEGQFTRSVQEFKDLAEQWDFDLAYLQPTGHLLGGCRKHS